MLFSEFFKIFMGDHY